MGTDERFLTPAGGGDDDGDDDSELFREGLKKERRVHETRCRDGGEPRPMSGERKPPLACRERPLNREIRGKTERAKQGAVNLHVSSQKSALKHAVIFFFFSFHVVMFAPLRLFNIIK